MKTTIHIEIERLILDGWPLDQRQARLVQAAIETELSRRLESSSAAGQLESSSALAYAATEPIIWNMASGSTVLGNHVGEAISGSLR